MAKFFIDTKGRLCHNKRMETIDQSKNGVKVIVYQFEDGRTVEASCGCFGNPKRTHSNIGCPLLKKQMENEKIPTPGYSRG